MTKKKLAEVKDKSDHPQKRLQLGALFFCFTLFRACQWVPTARRLIQQKDALPYHCTYATEQRKSPWTMKSKTLTRRFFSWMTLSAWMNCLSRKTNSILVVPIIKKNTLKWALGNTRSSFHLEQTRLNFSVNSGSLVKKHKKSKEQWRMTKSFQSLSLKAKPTIDFHSQSQSSKKWHPRLFLFNAWHSYLF